MKLEDIKPRYITLSENYDEFARHTEDINYDEEDFLSQVLQVTSVIYWLNIESIWGFIGWTWDTLNDNGHFNAVTMNFSVIPKVPDGHRLKQFLQPMFEFINQETVELLNSNFSNVYNINDIANIPNKKLILHLESVPDDVDIKLISVLNNIDTNKKGNSVELYRINNKVFYEASNNEKIQKYGEDAINRFYKLNNNNKRPINTYFLSRDEPTTYGRIYTINVYTENDVFDTKDFYVFNQIGNSNTPFALMAKSNKIIIYPVVPISIYNIPGDILPYFEENYVYDENFIRKKENYIDLTIDFSTASELDNTAIVVKTINNIFYKKISYKNLDYIKSNVYVDAVISRLIVIPEVENEDWFWNDSFIDNIIYAYSKNKIITNALISYDDYRNSTITGLSFNNIFVHYNEDAYKEINLYNQNIKFGILDILIKEGEYNDKNYISFPIRFTNSENSNIFINITSHSYIYDNNGFNNSYYGKQVRIDYPIISKYLYIENGNIVASENINTVICSQLRLRYNPTVYFYGDGTINYKAPIKVIIDKLEPVTIIGPTEINIPDYNNVDFLNNVYNSFIYHNIIELDNTIEHIFTTSDMILIGCGRHNTSGGSTTIFKNIQTKYKGFNCYINAITNGENDSLCDSTVFYFNYDVENWDCIFNVTIAIITIQTNIHIFVDAIMDEEITTDREISIIHENYIQLTEEERNKIINLGYTLIDRII